METKQPKKRTKRSAIERPAPPRRFSAGVEALLGPASSNDQTDEAVEGASDDVGSPSIEENSEQTERESEENADTEKEKKPKKPPESKGKTRAKAKSKVEEGHRRKDDDPMTIDSFRYRKSYKDGLDRLVLQQKLKDKRVRKYHLIEEALDLLFEKYGFEREG